MSTLSLRIPDEVDAELTALAAREHRSKNAAILALITDGIARAHQADADHNERLFAELRAAGPGGQLTGEQVAADMAAIRAERDAELFGRL